TICYRDWSSDVCSSDLFHEPENIVIQRKSGSHNIGYDATTRRLMSINAMLHHFGRLMIVWVPVSFSEALVNFRHFRLVFHFGMQIGRASCRESAWFCCD